MASFPRYWRWRAPSVHVVGNRGAAFQWVRAHGPGAALNIGNQIEAVRRRKSIEQTIVYGLAAIGAFALLRMLF